MNELKPLFEEHDLFLYCQSLRLHKDEETLLAKMEKEKKEEGEKLTFKQKASNALKEARTKIKGYPQKSEAIEGNLASFASKNEKCPSEEEAKELLVKLFAEDPYGASKLTFAITVLLDEEYPYEYGDEGMEAVSSFLYGNPKEMKGIYLALKDAYRDVSPKSLSSVQKAAFFGVALAAASGALLVPTIFAAGGAISASSLAAMGFADIKLGASVLTAESLLFASALVGATYAGMKLYNEEKVKKQFRKLSPEKGAMYLAIQIVYIERLKKTLKESDFKERLDEILKGINTLKADLDYYYFVEKDDPSNNKAKLKSFHNFDAKLTKLLGL